MMNINIDIEDTSVIFQQLQNGKNDVICVTETAGLALLCMMKASSPVDGYPGVSSQEYLGGIY